MASTMMLPLRPVVVQLQPTTTTTASASADGHKSPNWWAPLFGFSSEPDYMNPGGTKKGKPAAATEGDSKPAKTRFAPGSFTEEKARRFRKMTSDAPSFHETMYHSAVASRLASDFSDRSAD